MRLLKCWQIRAIRIRGFDNFAVPISPNPGRVHADDRGKEGNFGYPKLYLRFVESKVVICRRYYKFLVLLDSSSVNIDHIALFRIIFAT